MADDSVIQVDPPATPSISVEPKKDEPGDLSWKDKVKDKSQGQLMEMYGEASKKLGEMSESERQKTEVLKKMNVILAAIGKDPTREKMVKLWIDELNGGDGDGDGGGDGKDKKTDPALTDVRRSQESEIINRFEARYGIDKLAADKKKEDHIKIGNALWELVDPRGEFKNYEQMLDSVPLQKLDKMLENAYWIANRDKVQSDLAIARKAERDVAEMGAIGGISSSSAGGEGEDINLTQEQRYAAKKMGVSEDKYKERMKEIIKSRRG